MSLVDSIVLLQLCVTQAWKLETTLTLPTTPQTWTVRDHVPWAIPTIPASSSPGSLMQDLEWQTVTRCLPAILWQILYTGPGVELGVVKMRICSVEPLQMCLCLMRGRQCGHVTMMSIPMEMRKSKYSKKPTATPHVQALVQLQSPAGVSQTWW